MRTFTTKQFKNSIICTLEEDLRLSKEALKIAKDELSPGENSEKELQNIVKLETEVSIYDFVIEVIKIKYARHGFLTYIKDILGFVPLGTLCLMLLGFTFILGHLLVFLWFFFNVFSNI